MESSHEIELAVNLLFGFVLFFKFFFFFFFDFTGLRPVRSGYFFFICVELFLSPQTEMFS